MSNPVRCVAGVSYCVGRSSVSSQSSPAVFYDFGVCCRCVNAKTDPDGSATKDDATFCILDTSNRWTLPGSSISVVKDCGIKLDVVRVNYTLSGVNSVPASADYFLGFVGVVELSYGTGGEERIALATHSFDMSSSSEVFEFRDIPGFKANAGGQLFVFVKIFSLNSDVPASVSCVGTLCVNGSYHIAVD